MNKPTRITPEAQILGQVPIVRDPSTRKATLDLPLNHQTIIDLTGKHLHP